MQQFLSAFLSFVSSSIRLYTPTFLSSQSTNSDDSPGAIHTLEQDILKQETNEKDNLQLQLKLNAIRTLYAALRTFPPHRVVRKLSAFGFRVQGLGCGVTVQATGHRGLSDSWLRVCRLGSRVCCCRVQGFMVQGLQFLVCGDRLEGLRLGVLGFSVQGLGFVVQVLWFRVCSLGFRVQGLWFRVSVCGLGVEDGVLFFSRTVF